MYFLFGFPKDSAGDNRIVFFVDRFSKMAHLVEVQETSDGEGTAQLYIDQVLRRHGLPVAIVSNHDPRFYGKV